MQMRTDICVLRFPVLDANCFSSGTIGCFSGFCDRLVLSKQANRYVCLANVSFCSFSLPSCLNVLVLKPDLES